MPPPAPPIEHVVVLMMENAAFDRMLGCMTEVHAGMEGVDPAHPHTNPDPDDGAVAQAPTTARNIDRDPHHYLPNGLAQLAGGTNQGFVADFARTHPNSTSAERREIMGYYPRGFLPALHTLAEHFVVCDHWFSSLPGPTWINRLFAHTGTSLGHVSEPGSLFSSKLHLYNERTLYDELHDAGVPWRIYFGDVPQSLVLTHQLKHLANYRRFAHWHDDVASGDLPAYTFIEPTYFGPNQNDQHPPHDVMRGDALIAEVYNALRANPDAVRAHPADRDVRRAWRLLRPCRAAAHRRARRPYRTLLVRPAGLPGAGDPDLAAARSGRRQGGVRPYQPAAHGRRAVAGREPLGRRAKQANDPLAGAHLARDAAPRSARGPAGARTSRTHARLDRLVGCSANRCSA